MEQKSNRSGSKPSRTLTRMSSSRFKRTLIRKSTDERELEFPVSSRKSKLENQNIGQQKSNSTISGIMLTRKPSLKPVRKLAKLAASKSKKCSNMEISELNPESCVEKATCSSTFKGSKFPDSIELQPGEEKESEKLAVKKICPYSYCSLHGHSHGNTPPLKRFKSIRKRALRANNNKSESEPPFQAKQSGNRKKGLRASKMVDRERSVANETMNADMLVRAAEEESDPSVLRDIDTGVLSNMKESKLDADECKLDAVNWMQMNASKVVDRERSVANETMNGDMLVCATEEESDPSVLRDIDTGELSNMKESKLDADECNLKDTLGSSAFGYEEMEHQREADENPKEDLAVEIDSLSRTSSSSSISLNFTAEVQEINPKYIRMWQLVYKNVVDSDSGNVGNELPILQVKETSKEVDNKLLVDTNSNSFKLVSNVDQEGADVSPHAAAAYRKLELFKNEAIKLVQEAFDRILLPEIQEQQSLSRDWNSEEKLPERIPAEVRGSNLLTSSSSTHSAGEDLAQDAEDTQTKVENSPSIEEKKTMPIENRNQSGPKRWSNLKKLILLKRFVKALEKVKKINPQKQPRFLSLKPDPEGEKVHLQRQTTEERKNNEEWMLDYALQQVISKLQPAQKKRVSLLVEAFETVLPVPGVEAHIKTKVASDGTDKESERQNSADNTFFGNLLNMKNIVQASAGQANNINKVGNRNSMTFSIKSEANLEQLEKPEQDQAIHENTGIGWRVGDVAVKKEVNVKGSYPEPVDICLPEANYAILDRETAKKPKDTSYEEVSVNGKLLKISKNVIARLNTELLQNEDLEPDKNISKSDGSISVTSGVSDISKSLSSEEYETSAAARSLTCEEHKKSTEVNELLEKTRAAIFDRSRIAQSKPGSTQAKSVTPEETNAASSIGEASEKRVEEKKNASMWFLIYKHMASSIDAENGSKPLVSEEADKDEKEFSSRKQNMELENNFVNDPDVKLQCIEAIKLVNEAIDEIPLPENNTSPHDGSFSSNLIRDPGLFLEEKQDASEIKDRKGEAYDTTDSNVDEGSTNAVDLNSQDDEKEPKFGSKDNRQVLKNWSNLKKVILLKRFLKAIEKVKKFNPKKPNFLPLTQDAESEKVQLRHQDTEDRKNAEEWMLDYALQQAVAKLTPARKRKVELLVQAFETVNPTISK